MVKEGERREARGERERKKGGRMRGTINRVWLQV